jgi:hypothetical protein
MIVSAGYKTKKREMEAMQPHSKYFNSCIGDAKRLPWWTSCFVVRHLQFWIGGSGELLQELLNLAR